MDTITLISLLLATPTIIFSALSQIYVWQRKEYRWDRVRAELSERGLSASVLIMSLAYVLALISWWLNFPLLAVLSLALFLLPYLWRLFTRGIFRPDWTNKARLVGFIEGVALSLLWLIILFSSSRQAVNLLILIIIVTPLTALCVGLVNWLTNPYKRRVIARSLVLRRSLPDLTVVGVTGSYGKTTTKHLLSVLVPSAVVSSEHRNSPFVIAQDMQQQLSDQTKVYIVEMSAYRSGEIRELTNLTMPTVGVITNISNQHLALFGSLPKLIQTKWELIKALPSSGIAVLNADDHNQIVQAHSYPGKIYWFSATKPADVYASRVSYLPDQIIFQLHLFSRAYPVTVPLLSEAYLTSLLAAVTTALAVGTPPADIISRLPLLMPYPRTMQLLTGPSNSQIIDDSYSANEQSVLNALRHLQRFSAVDRRVIMVPLIELGPTAKAVHERIGLALKAAGAKVYVYGSAWHRELDQPYFANPRSLRKIACQNISARTVILLEGRIPPLVHQALHLS